MAQTKTATAPGSKGHNFVFVYGTLKRTGASPAKTLDKFLLFDGGYPLAVKPDTETNGTGQILGQLLEVEDAELDYFDRYEGHPKFYKRELIKLDTGVEAWMYFGNEAKESIPHRAQILPDEAGVLSWRRM